MEKIVEKKKKKKGRPSLLDLQKRTLKEQQQQLQQQEEQRFQKRKSNNSTPHSSHNNKSATPLHRSTRQNPSSPESTHHDGENEEQPQLNGRRREKKLKLALKLPSPEKSDHSSRSFNSNGSGFEGEGEKNSAENYRKRKVASIADGSGHCDSVKEEKSVPGTNPTTNVQDLGPSTPLPDEKLLLFILDRLQKKDTYGVFSEPVDPEKLPDYHEVIEHPMDFGTIRKKLSSGAYASLENFEKDVFLICSNAMQYNAPDTIYFRQARSIQQVAKKDFENLRQDSDDNEPQPKVVRRGRPPTKNLKRTPGRPSLDRAGSEFSSDATLAGGESATANNFLTKVPHLSDKSGLSDSFGRFPGSRSDAYWLAGSKFEQNDETTGSIFKGNFMKNGKKQYDENRRGTYRQFHPSAGGREPSVLTTFDADTKQLMAVGLLSEHGYARSLAQFVATIGPVAWKIASRKIERSLPPTIKFGPGWVGENDIPPQRPWFLPSTLPTQPSLPALNCTVESKEEKLEKLEEDKLLKKQVLSVPSASEGHLTNHPPLSVSRTTSLLGSSKLEHNVERAAAGEGLNSHGGSMGVIKPRPSFQIHQSPVFHPGMNGLNGTYGLNLPVQTRKLDEAAKAAGFSFQSSQLVDVVSRTNTDSVNPAYASSLKLDDPKVSESLCNVNSSDALPTSGSEPMVVSTHGLQQRPSWQGLSPQPKQDSGLLAKQKSDSVPPDLNVRFRSPGSPGSSRIDSAQPNLSLQL